MEKPAAGENLRDHADEEAGNEGVLSIDQSSGQLTNPNKHEYNITSAHAVDNDSWRQVGLMMVTSFNCAYILTFSNLMLVPLGWGWGTACLLTVAGFAFYANWLLAGFHVIDGHRLIRYRDIMGVVFGDQATKEIEASKVADSTLATQESEPKSPKDPEIRTSKRGQKVDEIEQIEVADLSQEAQGTKGSTKHQIRILRVLKRGRRMYYLTWFLQFLTLLLGNMGFILLGGRALKEINAEFSGSPMRLQVFVVATGALYLIFAYFVPTMSAMRNWLAASAVLTSTYVIFLLAIVVRDGKENKAEKDYKITGSEGDRVFNAFGAIAATLVCNTSGLLPEIQSTLREPVVNMRKALSLQFTLGLAFYYGVTVAGYWAYGSSVSEYLPNQLTGPKWGRILINSAAFLQNIISQHMFVAPVHEALDTKFLRLDESMSSRDNLVRLFCLRALLFGFNTLVAAAFPFMGDFVNLFGSFTLFPLTFVFPSMLFLKVRSKVATTTSASMAWHWFIVVISSLLSIVTTAAAVRLITNNAEKYSFFADT